MRLHAGDRGVIYRHRCWDYETAARYVVRVGDSVWFDSDFRQFGDGYIKARALDDRAGCAVLLELIKSDLPVDLHFVFTVQEEVGLRGAKTAAFSVAPEYALVVETTTAADVSGVPEEKQVCRLGSGAVVSFMDRTPFTQANCMIARSRLPKKRAFVFNPKPRLPAETTRGPFTQVGQA
jgi:putative aminopeptidase FrvX